MEWVDWFDDGTVVVAELGLACCAAEFEAASAGRRRVAAAPPDATTVLVVSGTVTNAIAPTLARTARDLTVDHVVAYGACASAGGPYWDSPVVTTVDAIIPVSAYIPGCAPTPDALTRALARWR